MSRPFKTLALIVLVLFMLACNAVAQPFRDVQNLAGTAESFASALPVETLQAIASQVPVATLQALPSVAPTLEAFASALPNFDNYFDPQGTPVSVWNEIPIMPQATAGQEFTDSSTYSFKVNATVTEARDFYAAQLPSLGWSSFFNIPADDTGSVQVFQKDDSILTITITQTAGSVVVILALV